jgi:Ti-type conjugative transfer relaxase TraA
MAIQFARCEYISRSTGGNACRKAAYNARTAIVCDRTGETFSYQAKGDVSHHEVLLPPGAHPKFADSSTLWNEAEKCEKRKDSQVAKEIVLALPDDAQVALEDRIELAQRFARENFVNHGVAVQVDLHSPDHDACPRESGELNWHAHLLIATRRFSEDGNTFSLKKATDLDPVVSGSRHTVVEATIWGESWRDIQNSYFEEKGYDLKVDPLGILPQEHLGPVRMRHHMNQAIERSYELQKANEQLSCHPKSILEVLTHHQAIFTEHDVDRFLTKHAGQVDHADLKENVLSHLSVIPLYDKETGEKTPFFTTHEVRQEEEKLLRFADSISKRSSHALTTAAIEKGVEGRAFTQEQKAAYEQCVGSEHNLSIIQGRAGVGKSYVLSAICEAHKESGFRVIGLAPTHKVATALKDSGFEATNTCHGVVFSHKDKPLPSKALVVVDEAAMMGSSLSVELFNIIKRSDAKLILVGDDRQLSSVDRSGAFGLLAKRFGAVELQDVRRQAIDWQRAVSEHLSQGTIKEAVSLLQENQGIVWAATKEDSLAALLKDWNQGEGLRQILAPRNVDVDALNQGARDILRSQGKLGDLEITCTTQRGQATFAKGDRIQFTKTDKAQGLENGRFGVIDRIDSNTKIIHVTLDNKEALEIDPTTYTGLRHGYAATVYKAQGSTLERAYVLHGKATNKATNYVALTRQTQSLSLYVAKEETPTERALAHQMSRDANKSSSLLFDAQRDKERRQEDKPLTTQLKHGVEDVVTKITDAFHSNRKFYQFEKQTERSSEVTLTHKPTKEFSRETSASFKLEKEENPNSCWMDSSSAYQNDPEEKENNRQIRRPSLWRNPEKNQPEKSLPQKGYKGFWRDPTSSVQKRSEPQKGYKGFWREKSSIANQEERRTTSFQKEPHLDPMPTKILEEVSEHIRDQLHVIKSYAGTGLAHKAKDELHRYMENIETHTSLAPLLRDHDLHLMKEVDHIFKEQEHQLEHSRDKGMDFGM